MKVNKTDYKIVTIDDWTKIYCKEISLQLDNILNNEFSEKQIKSVNDRLNYIRKISIHKFADNYIFDRFGYKDLGPIDTILLQKLNNSSILKYENNKSVNTFCSSWAVYNNNIFLIKGMQRYDGSFEIIDSEFLLHNNNKCLKNNYHIEMYCKIFCYTNIKPNLNFKFYNYKPNNTKRQIAFFENDKFASLYEIDWNDDLSMKMYFTLYTQELFYNTLKQFNKLPNWLNLIKTKNFITHMYISKFSNNQPEYDDIFIDFISNKISFNEFKQDIKKIIIEYIKQKYISLIFCSYLQPLHSEDQTVLINEILSNKNRFINCPDDDNYLCHYILNKYFWSKNFTTDKKYYPFFNILVHQQKKVANRFITISYIEETHVAYKKGTDGPIAVKKCNPSKLLFMLLKNKDISFNYNLQFYNENIEHEDKLNKICGIISKITKAKNIVIKDGILAIHTNELNHEDITFLLSDLIKLID